MRSIRVCLFLWLLCALPCTLQAQSPAGSAASDISAGDVCQILGGAVALGFGLWDFAVPGLYGWWAYVPDAPASLVEAVEATNFFFSFSLSLFGATNLVMPLIADTASPIGRYWLWTNVALWTVRSAYQLIKPQGSHSPALQWGMTAAFLLTDALFLFSAIQASLPVR